MKIQMVLDLVKLKPKKKSNCPKKSAQTRERRIWEGWFLSFFSQEKRSMCTSRHSRLGMAHCTGLYFTAFRYSALHCTALHCTALHCTALHCTALHCTALH